MNKENKIKSKDKKVPEIPKDKNEDNEDDVVVPEVLETLKPKLKELVEIGFHAQRYSGPHPELVKKLTTDHIGEIINQSGKEDERQYKFVTHARIYNLIYTIIGVTIFVFLTFFFGKNDKELFIKIVEILVAFAGGFGIGVGYKSRH